MSKQNLEKALRRELEVLNDKIDRKIIRGLPYGWEARRHKYVQAQLAKIRKASDFGWFSRTFGLSISR